jgi:hypothetical protein
MLLLGDRRYDHFPSTSMSGSLQALLLSVAAAVVVVVVVVFVCCVLILPIMCLKPWRYGVFWIRMDRKQQRSDHCHISVVAVAIPLDCRLASGQRVGLHTYDRCTIQ